MGLLQTYNIRALSLDLDDTLWPIASTMLRAEQALHTWLSARHPQVTAAFDIPRMRALREQIWQRHPELAHDFTATRVLSLERAMLPLGCSKSDVADAFAVFFHARNQVELYPDVLPALAALAQRVPLLVLTNGNADLQHMGIAHFFAGRVDARSFGAAKPAPSIFLATAERAQVAPAQLLHVGDHPQQDVLGALQAGLPAVWLNRTGAIWNEAANPPETISTLLELL
jgi:FMN hydrolase / 5-amino-6-(5-phospho-D-ribitylamino)uracil phosphatase